MDEAEDAFDLISLILALALFTPILVSCAVPYMRGEVGGFGVQIEKTARMTEGEIEPEQPRTVRANDLLLMLATADRNTPAPKRLDINGLQVELDDAFFANKAVYIEQVRLMLPQNDEIELKLFGNASQLEYWQVRYQSP